MFVIKTTFSFFRRGFEEVLGVFKITDVEISWWVEDLAETLRGIVIEKTLVTQGMVGGGGIQLDT